MARGFDARRAYRALKYRARGYIFRLRCFLRRRRVKVGSGLVLAGKLVVRGPGRVVIGERVRVGMQVTPFTNSPAAVIRIGDGTFLNGTRISCESLVEIGRDCILADCRILDSDFHGTDPENRHEHRTAPVVIEDNVWIAINAVILKGVRIGAGSTITPNSVVAEDVPPRVIYGGNPGRVLKELEPAPDERSP